MDFSRVRFLWGGSEGSHAAVSGKFSCLLPGEADVWVWRRDCWRQMELPEPRVSCRRVCSIPGAAGSDGSSCSG